MIRLYKDVAKMDMQQTDTLSAAGIKNFLKQEYSGIDVVVFKTIDSTNKNAKAHMADGASHGTTIVSEMQTAGIGRHGRSFYSPPNTGIYMSVVIKADIKALQATLITIAAAVSVCRAIRRLTKLAPQVKWVNDIMLGGKKICGILTESTTNAKSGTMPAIIVGIGINFSTKKEQFEPELQKTAGSLFEKTVPIVTRNQLAAEILNQLLDIVEGGISGEILHEYKALSNVLGKNVSITRGSKQFRAKAVDIDENGALIVEDEQGLLKSLLCEEVSIRSQ